MSDEFVEYQRAIEAASAAFEAMTAATVALVAALQIQLKDPQDG